MPACAMLAPDSLHFRKEGQRLEVGALWVIRGGPGHGTSDGLLGHLSSLLLYNRQRRNEEQH